MRIKYLRPDQSRHLPLLPHVFPFVPREARLALEVPTARSRNNTSLERYFQLIKIFHCKFCPAGGFLPVQKCPLQRRFSGQICWSLSRYVISHHQMGSRAPALTSKPPSNIRYQRTPFVIFVLTTLNDDSISSIASIV